MVNFFSPPVVERLQKKKVYAGKKSNKNTPSRVAWYPQVQTGARCQKHEDVKSEKHSGGSVPTR